MTTTQTQTEHYQIAIEHWDDEGQDVVDVDTLGGPYATLDAAIDRVRAWSRTAEGHETAVIERVRGDLVEPVGGRYHAGEYL